MVRMGLVLAETYTGVAFSANARIIGHYAEPSSADTSNDISSVLSHVADDLRKFGKKLSSVSIVTDATRSALITHAKLPKVALFRLSSPEGRDSPTLLDQDLADNVLAGLYVVSGGHGFDGRTIGTPSSEEIKAYYDEVSKTARAFVVTSPFSILFPEHERFAASELSKLGAKNVWSSIDVSSETSMLDRESTAVLSAATSGVLSEIEEEVLSGLKAFGCRPVPYFGRNDGTVIGSALARLFPLETAWSVEGHSAAGASKSERLSRCLVAGSSREGAWLAGAMDGKPIRRRISYLRDILLHVSSPVLAFFPKSGSDYERRARYELMSDFVGSKKVLAAGLGEEWVFPFAISKRSKATAYAAISAATATIEWEWTRNIPSGMNLRTSEQNLRKSLQSQMKQSGAKTYTFGRVQVRPGVNLPDGTTRLTLQARGLPV